MRSDVLTVVFNLMAISSLSFLLSCFMFPYLHIRLMLGLLILYFSYISVFINYKPRDAVRLLLSINDMDSAHDIIEDS